MKKLFKKVRGEEEDIFVANKGGIPIYIFI